MSEGQTSAVSRIARLLRAQAKAGVPGARLPSVRQLTLEHAASPVTVSRALALLQEEGVLVARVGAGTFIAERAATGPAPDYQWQSIALGPGAPAAELVNLVTEPPAGKLALASGYPDPSLQPTAELSRAMGRAMRRPGAWNRAPVAGLEALRAWFARRAGGATAQDVLLVGGGQAAIRTALQATTEPGQRVLFESPTYLGAAAAAKSLGLEPVAVPCDAYGIRPDLLQEAFERSGAKVLYCQPAFANPSGLTMSAQRRSEVLELARRNYAFVIEDDYAADLAYDGSCPPTLFRHDDGHVLYVRSLTKSVAPSLRIAALCARGPVMARLRASRVLDAFFVAKPLQSAALELVTSPGFARHLRRLQAQLGARMRSAVDWAQAMHPGVGVAARPTGGYSLWLSLPEGCDDLLLAEQADAAGVLVSAGRPWFPAHPIPGHLRISVAGAPLPVLEAGLERLGRVLRAIVPS